MFVQCSMFNSNNVQCSMFNSRKLFPVKIVETNKQWILINAGAKLDATVMQDRKQLITGATLGRRPNVRSIHYTYPGSDPRLSARLLA